MGGVPVSVSVSVCVYVCVWIEMGVMRPALGCGVVWYAPVANHHKIKAHLHLCAFSLDHYHPCVSNDQGMFVSITILVFSTHSVLYLLIRVFIMSIVIQVC